MRDVLLGGQLTPVVYLTTINDKSIYVKQDYLNHAEVSGNKLRKLKYSLLRAQALKQTLLSFGGAYSNHIAALAAAGKYCQLQTVGIIRGEELSDTSRWGKTLRKASNDGMKLHFVSRKIYREKEIYPHVVDIQNIIEQYPNSIVIPEGGSNQLSLLGSAEIVQELAKQIDMQKIFLACGTGGTMAGVIDGASKYAPSCDIVGISVLKNNAELTKSITRLSSACEEVSWTVYHEYSFGGYAKSPPELMAFMDDFECRYAIPLDPIYTAKLFFAVFDRAKTAAPDTPETWVVYHSGGLQGRKV